MKKGLFLFLTILLALSSLLVGCGSDGKKSNGDSKTGGTMVFARGGDSTSLDPITSTEGETFRVTDNIFENLLEYGEEDTTVQPALAESWDVSADGLVYTFKLLKDVKFHDGTDFNADAVVYNFDRWMNGDVDKFPYYTMFGDFKGKEGAVIKEVKAVDASTVQFTLTRSQAPFLKNLAMSPFGIASPAALEKYGDDFRQHPVGTGPFQFVEWKESDKIVIKKFKDYHVKGEPKLDQVIFRVIPDNTARLNALKNGEVDVIDGLNPSDESKVSSDSNLQIIKRPSMNVGYLGFNVETKPFDNKLVRQALNMAIDKKALIDAFYAGQAIPAKNAMPPSIEGYNDAVTEYKFDLAAAKAKLAEAGFPNGFTIDLWAMPVARPYMPEAQKVAEVIQANFKEIGVTVNVKSEEWATYLDDAAKGNLSMFMLGWTGDNGDADNFLYTLLDKDSIGGNNYSRYSNDALHDILIKAQTESEPAKRNELYKQAQVIIHDDAPWVPLVHSTPLMAAGKNVKGYVPHPTGSESFKGVSIK
jgi:peptide/nickel transport system substrate-binding protein